VGGKKRGKCTREKVNTPAGLHGAVERKLVRFMILKGRQNTFELHLHNQNPKASIQNKQTRGSGREVVNDGKDRTIRNAKVNHKKGTGNVFKMKCEPFNLRTLASWGKEDSSSKRYHRGSKNKVSNARLKKRGGETKTSRIKRGEESITRKKENGRNNSDGR